MLLYFDEAMNIHWVSKVMVDLIISMRPRQWVKNLTVFAGLIFSGNLTSGELLNKSTECFGVFCLMSGGVYLLNDVFDVRLDRLHPIKKNRPIASGAFPLPTAIWCGSAVLAVALVAGFALGRTFGLLTLTFVTLNLLYSVALKRVVIIDVFCISLLFLLRVLGGAVAIEVDISSWLFVCTILLALFLAICKRRHELVLLNENASEHRSVLKEYNPAFLDQMISVVTASTLLAYALYTMAEETRAKFGTEDLKYTIPLVLYGIFRYLYLVYKREEGGQPERTMVTDKPLLISIGLWATMVGVIIYL